MRVDFEFDPWTIARKVIVCVGFLTLGHVSAEHAANKVSFEPLLVRVEKVIGIPTVYCGKVTPETSPNAPSILSAPSWDEGYKGKPIKPIWGNPGKGK